MERSVNKIQKLLKKYKVLSSALVISLYHERNGNAKKKKIIMFTVLLYSYKSRAANLVKKKKKWQKSGI